MKIGRLFNRIYCFLHRDLWVSKSMKAYIEGRDRTDPIPEDKPAKEEIELLKNLSILNLETADIIILRHPGCLSEAAYLRLKMSLKEIFPGNKVQILEEDMEIGVIRKKEEEKAPAVSNETNAGTEGI